MFTLKTLFESFEIYQDLMRSSTAKLKVFNLVMWIAEGKKQRSVKHVKMKKHLLWSGGRIWGSG